VLTISFQQAPGGAPPTAYNFFEGYLSAFICLFFFIMWELWNRGWWLGVNLRNIDLAGIELLPPAENPKDLPWWNRIVTAVF
jgi:yeast amino acid transporter